MVNSDEIVDNVGDGVRDSSEMLSAIFKLNPEVISLTKVSNGEFIDCNQDEKKSKDYRIF
jgi:hypothetical protein